MRILSIAFIIASLGAFPAMAATQPHHGVSRDVAIQVIASHNCSKISPLKKDSSGAWHGMAVMNGDTVAVTVDKKGNFSEKTPKA